MFGLVGFLYAHAVNVEAIGGYLTRATRVELGDAARKSLHTLKHRFAYAFALGAFDVLLNELGAAAHDVVQTDLLESGMHFPTEPVKFFDDARSCTEFSPAQFRDLMQFTPQSNSIINVVHDS